MIGPNLNQVSGTVETEVSIDEGKLKIYAQKYAPAEMAESWVGASTLRRQGKLRTPEKNT